MAVILAVVLILNLCLLKTVNGFSLFDGDSCSRTLGAWKWAKGPTLKPVFDIWLNLHFWIVGFGLRIYPDTILIPVIINTFFFLCSLAALFLLTIELFPEYIAAGILAAGLAAFHPFLVWMSLSGLDVHIFYFFTVAGIFFWIKYIKEKKNLFLFLAAISFSLSTGVRYEGWIFTFIFSCLVLRELVSGLKKQRVFDWPLFSSLILAWFFVFYWLIVQKIYFGKYLFFLFQQYGRIAKEPISIGVTTGEILKSFLIHSIRLFPWPVTFFALLFGMIRIFRSGKAISDLIIFTFIPYIILMGLFVFGLRGSWTEKSTAITSLLLLPFCGFAMCSLLSARSQQFQITIASLLIGISIWFNIAQNAYNPRHSLPYAGIERSYARQCAMILRSLYRAKELKVGDKVLLEQPLTGLNIFEGYFIRVIAPDHVVWDRTPDYRFKDRQVYLNTENNPSNLELPVAALNSCLKEENIRIVVAVSEQARLKLAEIMDRVVTVDGYDFYVRKEDKDLASDIKKQHAEVTANWYDQWLIAKTFQIRPFWN